MRLKKYSSDLSANSWQVIEKITKINRKSKWELQDAIIDSQTTKNSSSCCKNIGTDGGKLIKGRKRFYVVDTLGNLLDSFVVSANSYDGTTAIGYWESLSCRNCLLDNIEYIYADSSFGGTFSKEMSKKYKVFVEIPKTPIAQKGKVKIHEKRWMVERTIAWTLNNRRCSKDYERKTEHANAYLIITNIRRLAKKY